MEQNAKCMMQAQRLEIVHAVRTYVRTRKKLFGVKKKESQENAATILDLVCGICAFICESEPERR